MTDKYDRFMSELSCPVILIGKTESAVDNPAITVRDGNGLVRTFRRTSRNEYSGQSELPSAIGSSRCIGDTLKPCK
jgi:hypothetical protein